MVQGGWVCGRLSPPVYIWPLGIEFLLQELEQEPPRPRAEVGNGLSFLPFIPTDNPP